MAWLRVRAGARASALQQHTYARTQTFPRPGCTQAHRLASRQAPPMTSALFRLAASAAPCGGRCLGASEPDACCPPLTISPLPLEKTCSCHAPASVNSTRPAGGGEQSALCHPRARTPARAHETTTTTTTTMMTTTSRVVYSTHYRAQRTPRHVVCLFRLPVRVEERCRHVTTG